MSVAVRNLELLHFVHGLRGGVTKLSLLLKLLMLKTILYNDV